MKYNDHCHLIWRILYIILKWTYVDLNQFTITTCNKSNHNYGLFLIELFEIFPLHPYTVWIKKSNKWIPFRNTIRIIKCNTLMNLWKTTHPLRIHRLVIAFNFFGINSSRTVYVIGLTSNEELLKTRRSRA